jgi:outer membrane protein OmpA-like peptidoglycan-associated protein
MKSMTFALRPIVVALIPVLALQGCATQNQQGGKASVGESFKHTFASDDPCSNSKRNVGILAGAILGGIIGNQAGGNNKEAATLVGMGAGAAIGAIIGAELDNRQCELYKIQQKYALEMKVTPITTNANANNGSSTGVSETQKVGLSVSIVDREGKPQFLSGSDELQSDARQQFMEIAQQYSAEQQATQAGARTNEEKIKATNELRKKRVLLIGHTDDTGKSKLNADLSERRAKVVAQVFKSMGVGDGQLYYQGAGETLPISDNATPEGRAKNRRVEIVDLSDEETFRLYLQNRRPNTAYYRPADTAGNTMETAYVAEVGATSASTANKGRTQEVAKMGKAEQTATASESVPSQPELTRGFINFGGLPATSANATVNIGEMAKAKRGFMLISEAQASDMAQISSCNKDRPRNAGAVKSFKDGKAYATSEYLPGLYGRSWQDTVGGNLIVLNGVAVLRDGAAPANAPNLKVYANYKPSQNRNPKPDVIMTPAVNAYQGSNGLLYRVFTQGERGMQCMDVLMPADGTTTAKAGKVIYGSKGSEFVSDFKPTMIR